MITLQDLSLLTNDMVGNYSTGTVATDVQYRAINRAIEYCKRLVSLPTDERIHTFQFTDDQLFYNIPNDAVESLQVLYNTHEANVANAPWEYYDYPSILQNSNKYRRYRWSITSINGRKQLMLSGKNQNQGQTILTMDSLVNTAASADASGLIIDTNIKHEGTGSVSFDITRSAGVATITFSNLTQDLTALFDRLGYIKLFTQMTAANVTSMTLRLQSSAGNHYNITTARADDGTAFKQNSWQKIGFATENAITVGSPNIKAINTIAVSFNLGVSFTSGVDFRLDQMFTAYPDKMNLIYLTDIKGYAIDGVTTKRKLDVATDILLFSNDYDDFAELVAERAAINLWTQLRGDKEAYMMMQSSFKNNASTFTRRYPRKRIQGTFRHLLRR